MTDQKDQASYEFSLRAAVICNLLWILGIVLGALLFLWLFT